MTKPFRPIFMPPLAALTGSSDSQTSRDRFPSKVHTIVPSTDAIYSELNKSCGSQIGCMRWLMRCLPHDTIRARIRLHGTNTPYLRKHTSPCDNRAGHHPRRWGLRTLVEIWYSPGVQQRLTNRFVFHYIQYQQGNLHWTSMQAWYPDLGWPPRYKLARP